MKENIDKTQEIEEEMREQLPEKNEKKARSLRWIWPAAFFVSLLALLFFLLNSFPLEAGGFQALKNRPGLMPSVRMDLYPKSAYHLGVAELDASSEKVVGTMLLYEMDGGEALVLVDIETLEEMSSSPEPISVRGVISKLDEGLSSEIQRVIQKYYDLSEEQAGLRLADMVYVDTRWATVSRYFVPMFVAAGVAVICLIASILTGKKAKSKAKA